MTVRFFNMTLGEEEYKTSKDIRCESCDKILEPNEQFSIDEEYGEELITTFYCLEHIPRLED